MSQQDVLERCRQLLAEHEKDMNAKGILLLKRAIFSLLQDLQTS